jgi:hypothetical protein
MKSDPVRTRISSFWVLELFLTHFTIVFRYQSSWFTLDITIWQVSLLKFIAVVSILSFCSVLSTPLFFSNLPDQPTDRSSILSPLNSNVQPPKNLYLPLHLRLFASRGSSFRHFLLSHRPYKENTKRLNRQLQCLLNRRWRHLSRRQR